MNRLGLAFQNWSYQDYRNYIGALNSDDAETAFSLALKVIVMWDYQENLGDPDVFDKLTPTKLYPILRSVTESANTIYERADGAHVTVNLDLWTMKRLAVFQNALAKNKPDLIEEMLKEVCIKEGVDLSLPLNFMDGVDFENAFRSAHKKAITGKN